MEDLVDKEINLSNELINHNNAIKLFQQNQEQQLSKKLKELKTNLNKNQKLQNELYIKYLNINKIKQEAYNKAQKAKEKFKIIQNNLNTEEANYNKILSQLTTTKHKLAETKTQLSQYQNKTIHLEVKLNQIKKYTDCQQDIFNKASQHLSYTKAKLDYIYQNKKKDTYHYSTFVETKIKNTCFKTLIKPIYYYYEKKCNQQKLNYDIANIKTEINIAKKSFNLACHNLNYAKTKLQLAENSIQPYNLQINQLIKTIVILENDLKIVQNHYKKIKIKVKESKHTLEEVKLELQVIESEFKRSEEYTNIFYQKLLIQNETVILIQENIEQIEEKVKYINLQNILRHLEQVEIDFRNAQQELILTDNTQTIFGVLENE